MIDTPHIEGSSCITKLNQTYDEWYQLFIHKAFFAYGIARETCLLSSDLIMEYYDNYFHVDEAVSKLYGGNLVEFQIEKKANLIKNNTIEQQLLNDFAISYWLKTQISDSKQRDLIDALRDAELLVLVLKQRNKLAEID